MGSRANDGGVGVTVERDVVAVGEFEFDCGRSLPLELAYEAHGEFDGDNAVLVCHALTGSANVADAGGVEGDDRPADDRATADPATLGGAAANAPAGQARAWWDGVVGPGRAVDTTEYYVVCVNVPGSCYGSTGPASVDPETGEPYGADFPPVTVADWTRAQRRLLDAIGVERLHAVVGGSVGGMNVLEWAKRYPDRVDHAIPVATAARLDAQCLALDAVAARAITTDPNWNGGDYYGGDHPDDGLAIARMLGHVMYTSKDSLDAKFGRESAGASGRDEDRPAPDAGPAAIAAGFTDYRAVESYLDYNGERFAERFDANAYLRLLAAMDDYDLAAGHDGAADALAGFDGEALVVSITGDWHFTVEAAGGLAAAFREAGADVAHHVVDSDHGHDAFLVEPERVGPPIADFLADGVDGRAVADVGASDEAAEPVRAGPFE